MKLGSSSSSFILLCKTREYFLLAGMMIWDCIEHDAYIESYIPP
jgi:hypothetical protein